MAEEARMIKRVVVCTLALAGLVACGDDDEVVAVAYASADQLRMAVEATGALRCLPYEQLANPYEAIERATCSETFVFSIHTDHAQAYASAVSTNEVISTLGDHINVHLVGSNWSINCGTEAATCESLRRGLGGEIVSSG